ncbi:hypothetical protein CoNPh26_CDS0108 [Staphylococcus phage S-CoN_Ph26]|nr:hypothetical protein CoNPh26_CDS0108 [Staphylococcus phage S-CoN_Ph26]
MYIALRNDWRISFLILRHSENLPFCRLFHYPMNSL